MDGGETPPGSGDGGAAAWWRDGRRRDAAWEQRWRGCGMVAGWTAARRRLGAEMEGLRRGGGMDGGETPPGSRDIPRKGDPYREGDLRARKLTSEEVFSSQRLSHRHPRLLPMVMGSTACSSGVSS
jgi:hypothetical protein